MTAPERSRLEDPSAGSVAGSRVSGCCVIKVLRLLRASSGPRRPHADADEDYGKSAPGDEERRTDQACRMHTDGVNLPNRFSLGARRQQLDLDVGVAVAV